MLVFRLSEYIHIRPELMMMISTIFALEIILGVHYVRIGVRSMLRI